ncbi:autotransporter outer membrane beta-barrel domain-containing protein [Pollutimonas bauzanensis]|uniref:autotransporter family protein n=1 Tax=Pollutimonas bauzanensis TaxID=658167 RepID=UPI0033419603
MIAQLLSADGITVSASGTFTTAPSETGLWALSGGVINGIGPVFITGDGFGAWAQSGGLITLDGGSVTTKQTGLYTTDGGAIIATGTTIATDSIGAHITNFGNLAESAITLVDVDITTTTDYGHGVNVENAGSVFSMSKGSIVTHGDIARGVTTTYNGTSSLNDVVISTSGYLASGVTTTSNGTSSLNNVVISTSGVASPGVAANLGGKVTLTGGSVTTTGANSAGLQVLNMYDHTPVDASGVSIRTSSINSHAVDWSNSANDTITLGSSTLQALGQDSHGLYARNTRDATAVLVDSSVKSEHGVAIYANNGELNVSMNNSTAIGGGALLATAAGAGIYPALNVVASNNSVLTGAAHMLGERYTQVTSSLSLHSGSVWNMTGDSVLTSLTLDSGAVFSTPFAANTYKTLTTGTLNSTDGVIGLNTWLGGDDSPSDKVVINTTNPVGGQTRLRIRNTGGVGDLTTANGIEVVKRVEIEEITEPQVQLSRASTLIHSEASEGSFALDGRVVAGAYEYQLYRGGSQVSEADNWYLRSQRNIEPPVLPETEPPEAPDTDLPVSPKPEPVPPVAPPSPSPAPTPAPLYRPEVAAYLANQRLVGQMFVQSLHDRQGSLQLTGNGQDTTSSDKHGSAWLRSTRTWGASNSQDANFHVDTDLLLLQGGGDVAKWGVGSQAGRIHVGTMFGYGVADSKVRADGNTAQARGKVEGYNGGVYATWFQNADTQLGAYVDLWTQYGWFNNRVEGEGLPAVRYDSRAWSVSGEAGYAFKASGDWMIEPQAQLTYVRVKTDSVTEDNGTQVDQANSHSVISRLGVRTYRNIELNHGRRVQPFATVNWWHTRADSTVSFDALQMGQLYPKNRAELKVGVNADLAKGWTGWASLAGSWGAQGYHQYGGRAGVKYTW